VRERFADVPLMVNPTHLMTRSHLMSGINHRQHSGFDYMDTKVGFFETFCFDFKVLKQKK